MREPVVIKDNAAGRRAFEVLQGIAERMWFFAQDITAKHAAAIAPNAKTIDERRDNVNKRYIRTLQEPCGATMQIAYDYRARQIMLIQSEEVNYGASKAHVI